jgi:hypothetical protein
MFAIKPFQGHIGLTTLGFRSLFVFASRYIAHTPSIIIHCNSALFQIKKNIYSFNVYS